MKQRHFKQKLIVLMVLFLGYLGYSLVFPILPPLFINPEFHFLPEGTSSTLRMILLGVAFGMYPLGQFVGCPMIGKLSDHFGRRPLLTISLFCCGIMYLVTALSVEMAHIPLLFISRFLTGLFESNIVIATAVMSDISADYAAKAKNFGWVMTFSSSAWILGPLIGGGLADNNLVSWFTFATPFWIAGAVFFFSFIIVFLLFPETLSEKPGQKLAVRSLFVSSFHLLKIKALKNIYLTNTTFYVATFVFFSFLPILLIQRFSFKAFEIGLIEGYLSIAICLAPFTYSLYKNKPAKAPMAIAGFGGALGLIFVTIPFPQWALWVFVLIPSYCISLGLSFATLLVSEAAPKKYQGEALGFNQACQVFIEAVVAIIGGFLVALSLYLPFIIGILAYFISMLLANRLPIQKVEKCS